MPSDSDSEWEEEDSASDASSSDEVARLPRPPWHTVATNAEDGSMAVLLSSNDSVSVSILKLEAIVCCSKLCCVGKREAVRNLLSSLEMMTKDERKTALLTTLAMCSAVNDNKRVTGKPKRERFTYYVPFIGQVCKSAFESIYDISHRTLHLYRKRVRDGSVAPKTHGGGDNGNAQVIDEELLTTWYTTFAEAIGDVVPVRVRRGGERADGTRRRYFSYDDYTLLPPVFTWDRLLNEYVTYLDDNYEDTARPSRTSFVRILTKTCPKIRIRSGRDQVCDQCAIYHSVLNPETNAQDTEVFGDHLTEAKALRRVCAFCVYAWE